MTDRAIIANELARAAYWRTWSTRRYLAPREAAKGRDLARRLVQSARSIRLEDRSQTAGLG